MTFFIFFSVRCLNPSFIVGDFERYFKLWKKRGRKYCGLPSNNLHGRSQDFSKGGGGEGGHTVSNRGYPRFRNLNIVGCLHKKRLTRGGGVTGTPGPPSPSFALDLTHCVEFSLQSNYHFVLKRRLTAVSFARLYEALTCNIKRAIVSIRKTPSSHFFSMNLWLELIV